MCRNIKTLHNFEPPATQEEVRASALQYVRKLTGLKSFSKANKEACEHAVDHITSITLDLFERLVVHGPPRTREAEKHKAIERGKKREQQLRERRVGGVGGGCASSRHRGLAPPLRLGGDMVINSQFLARGGTVGDKIGMLLSKCGSVAPFIQLVSCPRAFDRGPRAGWRS